MRVVALGSALVGGICLVTHLFLDVEVLSWVGLGLVGVAVAVAGARLARAWWLTVVTGLGALTLAWAVLEVARDAAPDREVEAAVGGLATLGVAVAVLRSTRTGNEPTGNEPTGNHRS